VAQNPGPLFLARRTYRRRRLMDIGRLMPFLGTFLFLVPVLWAGSVRTSAGLVYLFVVWGLLIVGLALLARPISRAEADPEKTASHESEGAEEP